MSDSRPAATTPVDLSSDVLRWAVGILVIFPILDLTMALRMASPPPPEASRLAVGVFTFAQAIMTFLAVAMLERFDAARRPPPSTRQRRVRGAVATAIGVAAAVAIMLLLPALIAGK